MEKMNSQERIVVEIIKLAENHEDGLSNKELARLVETSESNVCRELSIMEKHGWLARNKRGFWRLSSTFAGLANQIAKGFQTARLLLAEEEQKYSAAMR